MGDKYLFLVNIWNVARFCKIFSAIFIYIIWSKVKENHWNPAMENISTFIFSDVPANCLALLGVKTSASAAKTKFGCCVHMGLALVMVTECYLCGYHKGIQVGIVISLTSNVISTADKKSNKLGMGYTRDSAISYQNSEPWYYYSYW